MQPSVLSVAGEERRITPFTIPNPTGLLFVLKQLNFLKKKKMGRWLNIMFLILQNF